MESQADSDEVICRRLLLFVSCKKKTQKQKQYDTQVMRFYDKLRPKATAKCEGAGESHSSLQEQRFSTLAGESAQEFAP